MAPPPRCFQVIRPGRKSRRLLTVTTGEHFSSLLMPSPGPLLGHRHVPFNDSFLRTLSVLPHFRYDEMHTPRSFSIQQSFARSSGTFLATVLPSLELSFRRQSAIPAAGTHNILNYFRSTSPLCATGVTSSGNRLGHSRLLDRGCCFFLAVKLAAMNIAITIVLPFSMFDITRRAAMPL